MQTELPYPEGRILCNTYQEVVTEPTEIEVVDRGCCYHCGIGITPPIGATPPLFEDYLCHRCRLHATRLGVCPRCYTLLAESGDECTGRRRGVASGKLVMTTYKK